MPGKGDSTRPPAEWFARAEHDLETARLLFDQHGYGEIIVGLIQQGVEKYLKGYLLGLGWELVKTHDLELLLSEAASHNAEFADFLDFGRLLSAAYVRSRYPASFLKVFSMQELADMLRQSQRLVDKIKDLLDK